MKFVILVLDLDLDLKWKTKALKKPFCKKSNTFTSTKIATRDLLRLTINK